MPFQFRQILLKGLLEDREGNSNIFLNITLSSVAELETQVLLARRFGYIQDEQCKELLEETESLGKMTTKFYQRVKLD